MYETIFCCAFFTHISYIFVGSITRRRDCWPKKFLATPA